MTAYRVIGHWHGEQDTWDFGTHDDLSTAQNAVLRDLNDPTPADYYTITPVVEDPFITYVRMSEDGKEVGAWV